MSNKRAFLRQVFIYYLLSFFQVMIPVAALSAAGLVVSLFRTGKAAEALRFFILIFFLGGCAVAVLWILVTSAIALLRTKLRDKNDTDKSKE